MYFLSDTSNNDYIYYEMESIRRYLTTDNSQLKKGFLNFDLKKLKAKKGILHLPLALIPDSTILTGLQGIHYFDSAYEFETYKQAFLYFFNKADASSNVEINLTAGLFFKAFEIQKGDSILKNYISDSRASFKDYASSFIDGTLYSDLEKNTRDIVLCSDINVYTGTKKQFTHEYISSDSATTLFEKDFRSFSNKKLKNTEVYFMTNQTSGDFSFLNSNSSIVKSLFYIIINPQKSTKDAEIEEDEKEGEEDNPAKTKERKKKESWDSDENSYSSYMYSLEPETWTFIKSNNIRSLSGFYSTRLYDKTKIGMDVVTNASGVFVPGVLFLRRFKGSRIYRNRMVFVNFNAPVATKSIRFQFEEAKDKYRSMDYVNALYFKIIRYKNK